MTDTEREAARIALNEEIAAAIRRFEGLTDRGVYRIIFEVEHDDDYNAITNIDVILHDRRFVGPSEIVRGAR